MFQFFNFKLYLVPVSINRKALEVIYYTNFKTNCTIWKETGKNVYKLHERATASYREAISKYRFPATTPPPPASSPARVGEGVTWHHAQGRIGFLGRGPVRAGSMQGHASGTERNQSIVLWVFQRHLAGLFQNLIKA